MFLVGEYFVLHGQKYASAVHKVDYGKSILYGYLLGPKIFLCGDRKPGPSFYGRVICHDHALPFGHVTDHDNNPSCRTSTIFLIHTITCKLPHFNDTRTLINERFDSLTRGHLALCMVLFNLLNSPSQMNLILLPSHLGDELLHSILVLVPVYIH